MKIGFFPCNNGLGHIKRSLYIANLINKKIPIDFYSKIKNKKKFNINKNIKFKLINSPKNLNDFSKKNYPNWFMKYLNLNKYDILFSDTLPEVNLSNTKSIIFANFFWNKIYNLKSKIFSKITYNLKKKKNKNLFKLFVLS